MAINRRRIARVVQSARLQGGGRDAYTTTGRPLGRRDDRTRRGFTLAELLIVMAVLVLLVSISLPAVRRPLRKSELREAARELCAVLGRTRLEAIESGAIQQFRYRPGTGTFVVAPASSPIEDEPAAIEQPESVGEDSGSLVEQAVAPGEAAEAKVERQELPAGIRFADPAEQLEQESAAGFLTPPPQGPALADEQAWSAAVVFYPNGRAGSAVFRLLGQEGYYVDVSLRGLTGAATISEVRMLRKREEDELGLVEEPAIPPATSVPARPSAPRVEATP